MNGVIPLIIVVIIFVVIYFILKNYRDGSKASGASGSPPAVATNQVDKQSNVTPGSDADKQLQDALSSIKTFDNKNVFPRFFGCDNDLNSYCNDVLAKGQKEVYYARPYPDDPTKLGCFPESVLSDDLTKVDKDTKNVRIYPADNDFFVTWQQCLILNDKTEPTNTGMDSYLNSYCYNKDNKNQLKDSLAYTTRWGKDKDGEPTLECLGKDSTNNVIHSFYPEKDNEKFLNFVNYNSYPNYISKLLTSTCKDDMNTECKKYCKDDKNNYSVRINTQATGFDCYDETSGKRCDMDGISKDVVYDMSNALMNCASADLQKRRDYSS